MNRYDRTVTVFQAEEYDSGFPDYKATLLSVIELLQDKLEEIPEQYRGMATCEISSRNGYEGSTYATIEISYTRPETDEEVEQRIATQQHAIQAQRAEELRVLQFLKVKYQNDSESGDQP
jgi:hypothetical protein